MSFKYKYFLIPTLIFVGGYIAISAIAGLKFKQEFELLVSHYPTTKLKSYYFGLFESKAVIGIENHLTVTDFLVTVEHGPIVLSPYFEFNTFLPDLEFGTFVIRSDLDRALSQLKPLHKKLEVDHLITAIIKYSYLGDWEANITSNKRNVSNDYVQFDFEGMNIHIKPDFSERCNTVISGKIGKLDLKQFNSSYTMGPVVIEGVNPDFGSDNKHASLNVYIDQFKSNQTDAWDMQSITFNTESNQNQNGLLDTDLTLTVGAFYTSKSNVEIANLTVDFALQNFPSLNTAAINAVNQNLNPIAGLHKILAPINPKIPPEAALNQFSFSVGEKDYFTSSAFFTYSNSGVKAPNTAQDLIKNWQGNINLIATHAAPKAIAYSLKAALAYFFIEQYWNPIYHGKQAAKAVERFLADSITSGVIVKTKDEYRSILFYKQGEVIANGKRLTEAE